MKYLFFLFALSFPFFMNAQAGHIHAKCNHGDHITCGIFEPDSTTTITINSLHSNEPVEVLATMKDGMAFIEGGILVKDFNRMDSRGITCDVCGVWDNSTVIYEIDPNAGYPDAMIDLINQAIAQLNAETNLFFKQRTDEPNYVKIINGSGCYSSLGFQGSGAQNLSLKYPGCNNVGTIMHELLHASGVFHEQSREDRNEHIIINFDNLQSGTAGNFNQYNAYATDQGTYDKESIMHYGAYAFSSNGQPTITNLDSTTTGIGNTTGQLSVGDIASINTHYANAPLPVEFVDISIADDANKAIISWSTASEFNNAGFSLQKSADGVIYDDVAFVKPSSQPSHIKTYTAIDYNVLPGKTYYRIEQVDIDGKKSYSDIVYTKRASAVAVYPTKTTDYLYIDNYNDNKIDLVNTAGVKTSVYVQDGRIDVKNIDQGLYIVELNSGEVHKIIKY